MISLKERLTEILIHNKVITQEQLNEALKIQKDKGGKLSDIIIELKYVKESDLNVVLSEGLGVPLIDLKRLKLDYEVAKLIPVSVARHYQIVPISRMADTVTLAMADPLNIFAIEHVEVLTGYKINPIISPSQDILQAIELAYPDTAKGMIDDLVKEIADSSSIEFIKDEQDLTKGDAGLDIVSSRSPVVKIANMLLEEAVVRKSSDLLIEPFESRLRIRYRIDGMLHERKAPPKDFHAPLVSRMKVMANLNIAEHRLPQDGRFKVKIETKEIDFRISVLPSSFGEKVAIRILDKSEAKLDIEKLGFSEYVVSQIKGLAKLPHGMMLVCGPTGSGKTTTLYSILTFVDHPDKNIVTVEDPVEFQLKGINQVSVRPEIGLSFASALRSILRQDPNIIMIGEIRDLPTVDIAIKSALTGHLVLSTLHTTTTSGAVVRLVNMGVEPYLINASLICVVAQRLLRKVCPFCSEKYTLKDEVIRSLKLNPDTFRKAELRKAKGCPKCFMGYRGRFAIAEILVLSPKVKELILEHAQEHQIKHQARSEGMRTLREQGLEGVLAGLTSLEDVIRVTVADE